MYGLIGRERPLETELDFLVACIEYMRELPFANRQRFRAMMVEYFRLNPETDHDFIFDDLTRLTATRAGTLKGRDPLLLKRIHQMTSGEYFRIDQRLSVFQEHHRLGHPKDGWFTYSVPSELMQLSMDYHTAWSLATDGRLTFGSREKG